MRMSKSNCDETMFQTTTIHMQDMKKVKTRSSVRVQYSEMMMVMVARK